MRKSSLLRMAGLVLMFCVATATSSSAQTFSSLWSFNVTDGGNPMGTLVQGTDGNLYGTTISGGANQFFDYISWGGTVFKITPEGTLTTLYSFCAQTDCDDGNSPWAGLVQAADGNLYGTATAFGGLDECFPSTCGTVFKITPGGTLTTLHRFDGTDGEFPQGLVLASDGNLYGTTWGGGANNSGIECYNDGCGTVFKITPGGTLTTLYSFCAQTNCTDGSTPNGPLVQASDGNIYGTTSEGGTNCVSSGGCGTIFKITPEGALTTLYSFCSLSGCADGSGPSAELVQAVGGNFYGTTAFGGAGANCTSSSGCGTVFEITPEGALTTLYSFCSLSGCADGSGPSDLLLATDGNFYGTTVEGGVYACSWGGCGTIFKITPGGTLTTLHSFDQTDGWDPDGLVQATNGTLYGNTYLGGSSYCSDGCGTVFSLAVGLGPFVETVPTAGAVGTSVIILGTNLTGATSVTFNGTAAAFTVVSSSEITTTAPADATTGKVQVVTPSGTLTSNVNFQVLGTGSTAPTAGVLPGSLTFGNQSVGTTSGSQPVTLSNTGNAALTISGIATSASFGQTNNCGGSVAVGGSCTINVTFSPTATGSLNGTLTITDNSNGVAGSTQSVSLTGTGTAPVAGVSPPSLTFGNQNLGTTSASQPVTLSNTGTATLTITSIATSAKFGQTNNCGGSVAASGSCTINVTFSPTAAGSLAGTLTITDNNNGVTGSTQTVTLSGTGFEPVVHWPGPIVLPPRPPSHPVPLQPIRGLPLDATCN